VSRAARALPLAAVVGALLSSPLGHARAQDTPRAAAPLAPAAAPLAVTPSAIPSLRDLYRHVRPAVVMIESAAGTGAGFVFHSPRFVATAFHVVETGRTLAVTLANGARLRAEVVAVDVDHDIAVLELEREPRGIEPLELRGASDVEIGESVVAIGHPLSSVGAIRGSLSGLLDWTLTRGIVSGKSKTLIQTDAAVNPGNSGGPLLTDDGRVIGVVVQKLAAEGIGFATTSDQLRLLERQIGHQPHYHGRWTVQDLRLGYVGMFEPEGYMDGVALGLSAVAYDTVSITLRLGVLSDSDIAEGETIFARERDRFTLELDLSYRLLLLSPPFTTYGTVGIGGLLARHTVEDAHLSIQLEDQLCDVRTTECVTRTVLVQDERSVLLLRPMITASIVLAGALELAYAFYADPTDLSDNGHRIALSLVL